MEQDKIVQQIQREEMVEQQPSHEQEQNPMIGMFEKPNILVEGLEFGHH